MPTIYIEGQPYTVPAGQNVLQVCLSLGFDLPHFCWHPGLHSVGAFGMFFLGEYLGITLIAAMVTILFLGGWLGPWLPGIVWFFLKIFPCTSSSSGDMSIGFMRRSSFLSSLK